MEVSPSVDKKGRGPAPVLTVSIGIGISLLLLNIFRWTLVDWLTVFIEPLLELSLFTAFLAVTIWALVHFISRRNSLGFSNAITPFVLNILVLAIVWFVPFTRITMMIDFRWNLSKRMQVVTAVLDGRIRSGTQNMESANLAHLPPEFHGLSVDDNIIIARKDGRTRIFFFTFQGVLDSFSGFVYSADNAIPRTDDFGVNFIEVEQLRPNWYWAASRN